MEAHKIYQYFQHQINVRH